MRLVVSVALASVLLGAPALAHHSIAPHFDSREGVTGTVEAAKE